MDQRIETFHDGYWYCYANSTAMLLASIGERISPRLIEVLSGVSLGAFEHPNGLPFFSGRCGLPDRGISAALDMLGLAFEETASAEPQAQAIEDLEKRLETSPVLLGPLDMQHLVYNPMRPQFPGVDHFVLALGVQGEQIRLHDPAGFAHALIGKSALADAWRADAIHYKDGHYRCWSRPRRLRYPAQDELRGKAMDFFRLLRGRALALSGQSGEKIDGDVIRRWADLAGQEAFSPQQIGHMTHFAVPLGAKRALDYAAFFADFHPALAEIKRRQAQALGACHSQIVARSWAEAAATLRALAALEDETGRQLDAA